MDILANLRKLLGIQQEQPKQKLSMKPADVPVQYQVQPEITRDFNRITPGYQNAALNYERNFDQGNFNSPYIAGPQAIDPANFGYSQAGAQPRQRPGLLDFDQLLRRR